MSKSAEGSINGRPVRVRIEETDPSTGMVEARPAKEWVETVPAARDLPVLEDGGNR